MPKLCKIFINTLNNRIKLKQYRDTVKRAICNLNPCEKAVRLQITTPNIPSTYSGPAPDYIEYSDSDSAEEFNDKPDTSS